MQSTYSFLDVAMNINHPSVGQFAMDGQGMGSISVNMSQDRTAHDVAADGSVMISKIAGDNGTIAITAQQTSPLHAWLLNWWNYIKDKSTPSGEYALATIDIRAKSMGDIITASGIAPQKAPDKPYQQQGQMVTWNLMAADIQQSTAQ